MSCPSSLGPEAFLVERLLASSDPHSYTFLAGPLLVYLIRSRHQCLLPSSAVFTLFSFSSPVAPPGFSPVKPQFTFDAGLLSPSTATSPSVSALLLDPTHTQRTYQLAGAHLFGWSRHYSWRRIFFLFECAASDEGRGPFSSTSTFFVL